MTLIKVIVRLSKVLHLNPAKHSREASSAIRALLSNGKPSSEAYTEIQNLALKLGPLSSTQKPLSLALAQTSYLHGLIRRGDIYEARKMSLAFARAAARAPNFRYPFSRRRLPLKTMSSIIHALIGDNRAAFMPSSSSLKLAKRPTYSFLYLISQFPTPGARAARMFVSHHAKLGDRRALRDLLMILVFGLLSAEMIGGAVAVYSQWCRKYAVNEAQKSTAAPQETLSTSKAENWTTPSHVTWQPSKTLIKVLLDRLHASKYDPYKQSKGDALSRIAHLVDDRIRMGHYAAMISALSQYTRKHKSSQYTRQFEEALQNLSDDIVSGKLFTNTHQSDYKRVKEMNASSYNALIYHFAHVRDMQRVESLLRSLNSRYGSVRSDNLNAVLSASVDAGDIGLAGRVVEFLQWKLNNKHSHQFKTHIDEKVLCQLKKLRSYRVDNDTISALLKYYVAVGTSGMVAPLTYQHLPHLDLHTPKEEREKIAKHLDEQSYSDLFAALHRNLKTGLSVRLLNDRQLENMTVESLTSLMTILVQEASKSRRNELSAGWGCRRWIRTSYFHSKSRVDINNEKQYKKIYDFLKLRCNSATYLATSLYKNVRHRPSKHQVGRCNISIDEGFLRLCLKTFTKSRYSVAIDDVLLQYYQRGYTVPSRFSDRFEWIKSQDPHLIQSTFNKSRVPLIFPQNLL